MKSFFVESDIDEILANTNDILKYFNNKKIILTGGGGFLGAYFIETFNKINQHLNKPIELDIIDNLITGNYHSGIKNYPNFKFIKSDVSKAIKTKKSVDIIIHAAGIASPFYYRSNPLETLDVAINGTRNALDLAKQKSAKVIFFSSSEIYGDPDEKIFQQVKIIEEM